MKKLTSNVCCPVVIISIACFYLLGICALDGTCAEDETDKKSLLKKYEKRGRYKKIAKLLVQDAGSREEKIVILWSYVKRTITHPGSYDPRARPQGTHGPSWTIKTGEGTCLNQSILLFKMLKVIKEKPYYCLLKRMARSRHGRLGHVFVVIRATEDEALKMLKLARPNASKSSLKRALISEHKKTYLPLDTLSTFGTTGSYDYDKKKWKFSHDIRRSLRNY